MNNAGERGWTEQEIKDQYEKSMKNYLLGKKYGVTPALFVSNCIDEKEGHIITQCKFCK